MYAIETSCMIFKMPPNKLFNSISHKVLKLIYVCIFIEREKKKEREKLLYDLLLFQMPKGARNSIQVFHLRDKDATTWVIPAVPQGLHQQESGVRSGAGKQTHSFWYRMCVS